MKIGIDIDGVTLDFERTMRTYAELYDLLILRKNGVKDETQFDYLKRYDWTEQERQQFIDKYLVYATINSTPIIPLAKEMIELLKAEGHEIFFITARGLLKRETKMAVLQVFQRENIPTDNIHWGVKDKVSKCKELGIDVMIEDSPLTCRLLRDNAIYTLYFRDKNNELLEENKYLKEVSNIGEICRHIIKLSGFQHSPSFYEKILCKK